MAGIKPTTSLLQGVRSTAVLQPLPCPLGDEVTLQLFFTRTGDPSEMASQQQLPPPPMSTLALAEQVSPGKRPVTSSAASNCLFPLPSFCRLEASNI